jgi:FkbM family methyltransferase
MLQCYNLRRGGDILDTYTKANVSREDVIAAYEMFLGRKPESESAIAFAQNCSDRRSLGRHIIASPEFRELNKVPSATHPHHVFAGYVPSDLAVFSRFNPYQGPGQPGFVTNFLGVRYRTSFSNPLREFDGQVEQLPIPVGGFQGETAEFIGVLRSVLQAGERFTLLECGAGYGTWMSIANAAAKQHDIKSVRLYGIEGDSGHISMLVQHMADNRISTNVYTHIHGVVGAQSGLARWAVVEDSADVYGGRPMGSDSVDYHGIHRPATENVEVHAINDLLSRETEWDLIHCDVQGGEGEICRAGIELMSQRVKRVVIGTHSRALDGEVMTVFHRARWTLENEKPTIFEWGDGAPTLETMARVDGVQVWRNPRLISTPPV